MNSLTNTFLLTELKQVNNHALTPAGTGWGFFSQTGLRIRSAQNLIYEQE